jgi:hypothetical protein
MAQATQIRSGSQSRRFDRSAVGCVRELAVMTPGFMMYRQVRHLTSGDVDRAMRNATHVVWFERTLGLCSEGHVQRVALRFHPAIAFLDHYYVFVHFTASFGFMAWVFVRHPDAWRRVRTWFVSVTMAGLAIHVAFPLAPPRMQPGFVDTLHVYGPSIYSRDVTASTANQLAAMPSLHFGWSALVAAGVVMICRSRWRLLVLVHPVVTLLAIVATANHYWLDAIVAGALVTVAVLVTARPPVVWPQRDRSKPVEGRSVRASTVPIAGHGVSGGGSRVGHRADRWRSS